MPARLSISARVNDHPDQIDCVDYADQTDIVGELACAY